MDVQRFADDYDAVADLFGCSASELLARDIARGGLPSRWVAFESGRPIGAVSLIRRPDDRCFLSFVGQDEVRVRAALAAATLNPEGSPLHVNVIEKNHSLMSALTDLGFRTEMISEAFSVSFDAALGSLRRAVRGRIQLISAELADRDRLVALDNLIRQDVPGTDGWTGDRQWIDDELADSPPFDASAYLVAFDPDNGQYVGLVRIWRNSTGPRLGLIGVVPKYRSTTTAFALLRAGLTAASSWGYETFTTEASLTNRAIHPRLVRLGAQSQGRFHQMVRS